MLFRSILGPHNPGLQSRLCARSLQGFFSDNLWQTKNPGGTWASFCADVNLVAGWANLGYIEGAAIRNHILQSLISHPELYDHQADALIILFKLAGATFEAYADTSVIDRCFELLEHHYSENPMKNQLVQVCASLLVKGGHWANMNSQEVVALRERGWEGLPPSPAFTTGKPKPTRAKDPAATPVVTSLGLPNRNLEPQIPQPPPLKSVTTPEADTTPESPITQSPPISVATLSDFTIADTSDDGSFINPTITDTPDDELPIDPTAVTQHETFYIEDGNIEVLCGNTLFRVHTSIMSFHSTALRRMFAQSNLATGESSNGCPRILSSDTAKDFTTLLKIIYLPGSVALAACL